MDKIHLFVHDFRAVKQADISLNGITVVAGLNSCGKSTLSKLLYHTFYVSKHLDSFIYKKVASDLQWLERTLNYTRFRFVDGDKFFSDLSHISKEHSLDEMENECVRILQEYKKYVSERGTDDIMSRRLQMIFSDTLLEQFPPLERGSLQVQSFDKMIELAEERVRNVFALGKEQLAKRDASFLRDTLFSVFCEEVPFENFKLEEQGAAILDPNESSLKPSFYVKKVAYIDTPMVAGVDCVIRDPAFSHWEHLQQLLRRPPVPERRNCALIKQIQGEILHGSVSREKSFRTGFYYQPEKMESKYALQVCATGIKSFGIVQLLIENGFLDSTSLLILDEPESHLHPSWVVEYARLLVLLHKTLGVRLFIATHDSKMVDAIRSIAEVEVGLENVNFYLARKPDPEKTEFVFDALKDETGQIHKSFNEAYDLIDRYSDDESEEDDD